MMKCQRWGSEWPSYCKLVAVLVITDEKGRTMGLCVPCAIKRRQDLEREEGL